jgi:hypothetical protein
VNLRNSTDPWSHWTTIGPGSAACGSLAIAVSPSTSFAVDESFPVQHSLAAVDGCGLIGPNPRPLRQRPLAPPPNRTALIMAQRRRTSTVNARRQRATTPGTRRAGHPCQGCHQPTPSATYEPRCPAQRVLHQIVFEHFEDRAGACAASRRHRDGHVDAANGPRGGDASHP